jgi:hypothetical protein
MQSALERFSSLVALAHARHGKRIRFAVLMALLIAVLLWRTQWPTLWPGLAILLCTQLGAALLLLHRNRQLSRYLHHLRSETQNIGISLHWFDTEQSFLKHLALFENGARMIGFIALAYGFWVPTRSLWIALTLGLIYPVVVYFGMGRLNTKRTMNDLQGQKDEMQALLTH